MRGSHRQFKHSTKKGAVIVAGKPNVDIPPESLNNILNRPASRDEMIRATMQYTVIVEQGETSWGAYVPDLPGCIAAGETSEEVLQLIRETIEFHVEGLRESGETVSEPHTFNEFGDDP